MFDRVWPDAYCSGCWAPGALQCPFEGTSEIGDRMKRNAPLYRAIFALAVLLDLLVIAVVVILANKR